MSRREPCGTATILRVGRWHAQDGLAVSDERRSVQWLSEDVRLVVLARYEDDISEASTSELPHLKRLARHMARVGPRALAVAKVVRTLRVGTNLPTNPTPPPSGATT